MKNLIRSTTDLAMSLVRSYIDEFAASGCCPIVAVDATCGNGHDTLSLLEAGCHKVYAFDIQEAAIQATSKLLEEKGYATGAAPGAPGCLCTAPDDGAGVASSPVAASDVPGSALGFASLINDTHSNMATYVKEKAAAIVFNLGYLPGGDKSLTTDTETTMAAISTALDLLATGGILCITMYSGHPAGAKEKAELLSFAENLDSGIYHVAYINMLNQHRNPPEILLITKKR